MKSISSVSKIRVLISSMGLIFSAHVLAFPAVMNDGGIDYITGGIGLTESTEITAVQQQWPLTLQFVQMNNGYNEYLANVMVKIEDARGRKIMGAMADGPFLLVKLPPGRYNVSADYEGKMVKTSVNIQRGKPTKKALLWSMSK